MFSELSLVNGKGRSTEQMFGLLHLCTATTQPLPSLTSDTEGMLTMVEWHLELPCLKLMCYFSLQTWWVDSQTSPRPLPLLASPQQVVGFWDSPTPFPPPKCVHVCAVAAMLLEYSEECWEEALAIWSLLPALHNKNRHTSTPVMDDKETGT